MELGKDLNKEAFFVEVPDKLDPQLVIYNRECFYVGVAEPKPLCMLPPNPNSKRFHFEVGVQ